MGKIPNFADSGRLNTPKTDCVLKVYKDKEFYQLGLQVLNSEKRATLSWVYIRTAHLGLV